MEKLVEFLSTTGYFIIAIGVLVIVHEFGHFAAAKLSKMRVEAFSIGFGMRLFGWNKKTGFTFGELPKDFDGEGDTDYRLCLLPLGGYVKIAGMIDESGDVSFAATEPQPWEFRAGTATKKVFVITAGVVMNLLLAIAIFWGSNYFVGKHLTKTTTIGIVDSSSSAFKAGFRTGDKILTINKEQVKYWEDVRAELYVNSLGKDFSVTVNRDGKDMSMIVPRKYVPTDDAKEIFLLSEKLKPVVGDVLKKSPADSAGLKANDVLLSIDDIAILSVPQTITKISSSKEKAISIKLLRGKDTVVATAVPGKDGKIGIVLGYAFFGETVVQKNGFFESFKLGLSDVVRTTELTFVMLKRVILGQMPFGKAFGGPIKIAQYAARSADNGMGSFILFIGLLSLSLAILNILPIPALDGGHLVIIIIERIMKREISLKVKIAIQNAGMYLLFALMAFIIYNDFKGM